MDENSFVMREIDLWGQEPIDELLGKGFIPVLFTDGKWRWVHDPDNSDVVSSRVGGLSSSRSY